jgi:hypothetical protein
MNGAVVVTVSGGQHLTCPNMPNASAAELPPRAGDGLDALETALRTRARTGHDVHGVIHHSDAGSEGG